MAPSRGHLDIRSVGIDGVRVPLRVRRGGHDVVLTAEFAIAVDLPARRKGSDLSRNAQLLAEVTETTAATPVPSLEAACSMIARELLVRHDYATESSVVASAEYFLRHGIAPDRQSFEDYLLLAEARASRGEDGTVTSRRTIGAEAVGMTACPCAMETCRDLLVKEFPLLADPALQGLPMITHNQRNRTRLFFEADEEVEVEADEILAAISAAQSSPTYAILKRGDEGQVVLDAHRNPRFVEDVVRHLLADIPTRFPALPDSVVVRAETISEESIHKYDVRASHRTTLRDLRQAE